MYNVNSCMGHFLKDHLQMGGSKCDVHLPSKMVINMHMYTFCFDLRILLFIS